MIKIDALVKIKLAVKLAKDKKAEVITVLNVGKVSNICDYFVVIGAESSRKAEAIAEAIEDGFEKKGEKIAHSEGYSEGLWILLDAEDIIIHVFRDDMREFYDLERLWSQAPRVELE